MGKIAFVFSGQGAQYSGMGLELYRNSQAARNIFHAADKIRPKTSVQCFEGSESELCETCNTQPCIFTVELAAAAAMAEIGIYADMTAGFSLGELAALTYSGAVSFETGLKLVMQRGHLMQKSAEKQQTGMAAILRLEETQLENLCAQFNNIYPVNYNCPGQTVISGPSKDLPEFYKAVKLSGGKALPLKVSGGFHSPFMADASKQFSEILKKLNFKPARIPLYSNYTGERYTENIHELLTKQICNPVRWETVVRNMICNGVDTFIEIGPGKTLCGLIKKINSNVQSFASDDMNNWAFAASEVQAC